VIAVGLQVVREEKEHGARVATASRVAALRGLSPRLFRGDAGVLAHLPRPLVHDAPSLVACAQLMSVEHQLYKPFHRRLQVLISLPRYRRLAPASSRRVGGGG
jgi:hypothetical protein